MARKKKGDTPVEDYRYEAKRKNIPPAAIAAEGTVTPRPRAEYSYSPRLPPQLQFDPTGKADALPELLAIATQRALSPEEARILADALRQHQPWLEWAGKRERPGFAVDPVALHEHERVSTKAIIAAAMRQDVQRSLFADPELEHRERVKFYQHDIAWANRLILGDSLLVMSSLLQYENMAGKVQMIYIDPPYGIKFASNFQPEVGKRDVKDKESDLTREPEMVRAYRDTWHLGVHSYLTYLRDRLRVARELLADSGSIFVQISDENLHRVRQLLDEVFGRDNSVSVITFFKSGSQTSELLPSTVDYILWYARDINYVKRRPVWYPKSEGRSADQVYRFLRLPTGETRTLTSDEREEKVDLPNGSKVYRLAGMTSQSGSETTTFSYELNGQSFSPGKGGWRTNIQGMNRLCAAEMVTPSGSTIACYKYINDFPLSPHSNLWIDTGTGSFTDPKVYVVQTGNKACLLYTSPSPRD